MHTCTLNFTGGTNHGGDDDAEGKCNSSPMIQKTKNKKAGLYRPVRVPGVRAECARAFVASGRPAQTQQEWRPPSGRRR